ncbi:hypothetical protein CI109_105110 [Kwoniella shandongensis]|uniref:Uncharacterized protein n=1 Tax=Kwoniella shandongensis TaxID=1734106 RepID=A0A5M6C3A6_9TREE|nr:uncharacterized protein CI109_001949 [Kwoniella shandongensis]KAA5529524.1 hypothetical protein CI109_001949 [Kwoniella shandongensis]
MLNALAVFATSTRLTVAAEPTLILIAVIARRREAAELARVLELSTQEARTISHLSPHYLSSSSEDKSSGAATQDSKDMELRPYQPYPVPTMYQHPVQGTTMAHHLGAGVGTVRPEDIMRPPTINSRTGTESVHATSSGSGKGPSYITDISSFPPTALPVPSAVVPPTNTSSNSTSHTPSSSSNLPPSSFSHRKPPTSSNPIPSPAYSSPIPSADIMRLRTSASGNDRSHISSTEVSSNRPLFSPPDRTPLSTNGGPASEPRVTAPVKTYGKNASSSRLTPSPQKPLAPSRVVLSSSPMSEGRAPALRSPSKKTRPIVLSDSEEEEEEEQIEAMTPRSRLAVVVPFSKPASARSEVPNSTLLRHTSPDPLDNLTGQRPSPIKPAPASSATTGNGDISSSSKRASSRISEKQAKEAAEKEERRRKRREEKEKQRLAEERKRIAAEKKERASASASATETQSRRKRKETTPPPAPIVEEDAAEDSIVEIDPPIPKSTETNVKKRKSEVAELPDPDDEDGDFDPRQMEVEVQGKGQAKAKEKKTKKSPAKRGKKSVVEVQEVVKQPEEIVAPVEVNQEEVAEEPVQEEEAEAEAPAKSPSPPPAPAKSESPKRPPLRPTSSNTSTPNSSVYRDSPGPMKPDGTRDTPGGIKWKAPRNDLTTVLAKFGGTKRTGMSKRLRIQPLHQKIGTPVKALPPPPKKPEKKKKGEESDEDDDEEDEEESDGEGGVRKKVKVKKGKGLEWFMVED